MNKKNTSHLKKAKVFYLYFFITIFSICVFLFYQNLTTKSAVNQFLKSTGLTKEDLTYKSVSKSLFGNSLIFYKVEFSSFSFAHQIDKLVIKQEKNGYYLSINNAKIDVIHSLRKTYNVNITKELDNYIPVTDLLKKPIQSLALSNIDIIAFNLEMFFETKNNSPIVKGFLTAKDLTTIEFESLISKNKTSFSAKLKPIHIKITDEGFFEKYDTYLKSIGYKKTSPERSLIEQKELNWSHKNVPELLFAPTHRQSSI